MQVISLENVQLIRNHKNLLKNIQWQVNQGENWALLGLNGAGKTLLLQIITGNLWPSSGKVTVLGEVFGQTSLPELSKRIGWVSSALQVRLRANDLAEQIVLSGKFASIGIYQKYQEKELNRAKELLTMLQADSLIGKTYGQLSQGERQIVLIARGLMAKPELLILDEPCNGLDLFARERLLQQISQLSRLHRAPTILFVTHHTEEILPFISHVCLLRSGEIYAQGPRESLLSTQTLQDFYQHSIKIEPYGRQRYLVTPNEAPH